MPRPSKCRRICALPKTSGFAPAHAAGDTVILPLDEYEAVRLIDLEGLTQEECARQMGVSRIGANRVLVYQYLITVTGVASGVVFFEEDLGVEKLVGGAIIPVGVYLARRQ